MKNRLLTYSPIFVASLGSVFLSVGVGVSYDLGAGLCMAGICCIPVAVILLFILESYTDKEDKKIQLEIVRTRKQLVSEAVSAISKQNESSVKS